MIKTSDILEMDQVGRSPHRLYSGFSVITLKVLAKDKYHMRLLAASLLITALTSSFVQGQNSSSQQKSSTAMEIPTITFCEMIQRPEAYDNKTVRVKAIYRFGFEWSELYSIDCWSRENRTWVDFDESFESNSDSKLTKKVEGNGDKGRTVAVVFVGKFHGSGGGYGHLSIYKYKFQVNRVEKADIILNDSPVPTALPEKAIRRMRS